ncbi:hypothetical protein EB796_014969 [Bugula neritina]|uniref:Uncharacterized protein n=1 Tax=Bugula neritina TaxID=10212 RepID=A0A7J7JKX5_BUGNE|nr:hypothetical protein EB796_014969 [Bugula neritina]
MYFLSGLCLQEVIEQGTLFHLCKLRHHDSRLISELRIPVQMLSARRVVKVRSRRFSVCRVTSLKLMFNSYNTVYKYWSPLLDDSAMLYNLI